MQYTYKISSLIAIVQWHELIKAVFENWNGEAATFNGYGIVTVTFDTPQTPANLGPLVKVELIPNP